LKVLIFYWSNQWEKSQGESSITPYYFCSPRLVW